ncbi:MAG TPA: calcium-binding protein [Thermoleophilaceae bacterium]|jgi:hypothetical protein
MWWRLAVAVAVVLIAAPSTAAAATVRSQPGSKYESPKLTFQAARGEANDVAVSGPASERRVIDRSAPLGAGDGCRQVGEHEAICRDADHLLIVLGDGDDRATLANDVITFGAFVAGDEGDDVLTGGPGDEFLQGGDGRDDIAGGPGDDSIAGDSNTPFADRLDGGEGTDSLDYDEHPLGVRVDLSDPAAPAGAEGEGDVQAGFEETSAGKSGPSVLVGDDGANFLESRGRGSRVVGGGGDDLLYVQRASTADGGPGDDRIGSDRSSRVACGKGTDALLSGGGGYRADGWFLSEFGLVDRDCERLPLAFPNFEVVLRPRPKLRDGRASLRIPCPRDADYDRGCSGQVRLRDSRGRDVGSRRFRVREGTAPLVGVALGERALRRLGRPGGIVVVVSIVVDEQPTERAEAVYSVVLTKP